MHSKNLTLLTDLYELTMMQGYYDKQDNPTVIFDVFYRDNGIQEACWNMTVRVDTQVRLDSDAPAKKGETYCYLDSYKI